LGNKWYVRDAKWKLNREGELYDMSNAPFEEKMVLVDSNKVEAIAAKKRLQEVLDTLNPAGGIMDDGNGSGRHGNKVNKKANKENIDKGEKKDKKAKKEKEED
jgi:hypothetical protein